MKNTLYLLILLVGAVLFAGCYEDKGNYDYSQINDIVIDTVGFKTQYTVDIYDQLVIDPVVTFTKAAIPESDLAYEWHIYEKTQATSWEVFSTDKKLDIQITLRPGEYAAILYVTDTRREITSSMAFDVTISTDISHGILVLHGKDGMSDFDYIATQNIFPSLVSTKRLTDVLEAQGRKLSGNPLVIKQHGRNWGNYNALYVSSDEDMFMLDYNNLQVLFDASELFVEEPEQVVNVATSSDTRLFFTARGTVHEIGSDRPRWDLAIPAAVPVSPTVQGDVRLWKECTLDKGYSAIYSTAYFDTAGKRFLGRNSYPVFIGPYPEQQDPEVPKLDENNLPVVDENGQPVMEVVPKPFDINNIGKDILFMGRGFNFITYAVFKDSGAPNYWFYAMDFSLPSAEAMYVAKSRKDMSTLSGIADAKFFSVGTLGEVFIYATGRDIYAYEYAGNANAARKISADFPAGEEITAMKLYVQTLTSSQNERVLYVATWNGTEGKLYEFGFNPTNGSLTDKTPLNVFAGFGKIADITPLYQYSQDPLPIR